ncbi:ribosomal-protein-alanine N-acetyltransferase [Paucidesulfovibrio gracilis DSM 16080]|uniref:Ribosomal-protein-alanine N-acetyltransferase n=1 Tax=Paucidesulfovibrio gracilis DSM 16080 TaxID=1121449 RepID=A0A1T4WNJ9_9BACT|nr:ribosomal protein S18-alanine N-acetyltransferase [Paucidesulfovibrio gracilis]SKA78904.1 ribosomal-protein-alanine N-acetyltransferase [Paucidesulfovibrio gracilis DSM 16080]
MNTNTNPLKPTELRVFDIPALMRLERRCFEYHWNESQYKLGLERGAFRIYGIKTDGRLVAYLAFSLIAGEMEILNLAVHPDFRRQGLAKILLRKLFSFCAARQTEAGFLDVKRSNAPAIALYQQFGFEQYGVRKRYYPDTKEDALLFRCSFLGHTTPA